MKILFAIAASLIAAPAGAETLSGPATVIDGDTLEIEDRRVRLFGIDAPEASQTCERGGQAWSCGKEAASRLRDLVGSQRVDCRGDETDPYGRLVAVCTVGYVELNRTMVSQGWAVAFRKYSNAYMADEARASTRMLGIWGSTFELPESARRADPAETVWDERTVTRSTPRPAVGACAIKGNRNQRGEWIYHLPGMPYYEQTRAEEMFCTEPQAQAAGYRRSRAR